MNGVLVFFSIVLISYLFVYLTKKIKIPSIVALIIFGIILSYDGFDKVFIYGNELLIEYLGIIGLFSLMFAAGLESSYKKLVEEEKDAFFIALFGALTPFFLGFFSFLFFGFSMIASIVMGICMSITAEATKVKLLFEFKKLKTKVGSTMVGAGIIDDLFGLLLFSFVLFLTGLVDFREHIILVGVLISFFVGLVVQKFAREHHITKKFELFSSVFLVPFFFISMGLHFDLNTIFNSPFYLILIIILAMSGKIIGSLLAKKFTSFSYKQLYLIGWSMNSRGALELAFALLAFRAGILNEFLYSSLVVMALVTTIIFPFIFEYMIKKNPNIMK